MGRRIDRVRADVDSLRKTVQPTGTGDKAPTPAEFRASLLIDADGAAVPFRPDPGWQDNDFLALDPAWLQLAGFPVEGKLILRAWQERPRGHSKTSDLAIMTAWALAFSIRPIRGIAAAASKDQAGRLRDAIETLVRLNQDLREVLEVQSWHVVNRLTGSDLEIISSDVPASWGQLPDFIVADEVCHWPEGRGEELWGSLFSSAAKRAHCLLCAISNAGFQESWVWRVRELVRADPRWHFSRLEGPRATWITPDRLEEQRRHLPALAFDRLWGNVWSSGSGDALQAADIDASLVRSGPVTEPESGWDYYVGIDLSVSRDLSALVMIGRHHSGRLRLACVRAWTPPAGGKIDLRLVQHAALELHKRFHPHFFADPYQAELLITNLQAEGAVIEGVPFVGAALVEMASGLVEVFSSRVIELYPDGELLADLRRLRIADSPAGWRLSAPRTAAGHCDRAVALSLAVLGARRAPAVVDGAYVTESPDRSAFRGMPADMFADMFGCLPESEFGPDLEGFYRLG